MNILACYTTSLVVVDSRENQDVEKNPDVPSEHADQDCAPEPPPWPHCTGRA